MGDIRLIQEIGCSDDGGVWMSILFDVEDKKYTVICPMSNDKAKEVRGALDLAITRGTKWKETGINPNVGNSANPNKGSPKSDKRHSKRRNAHGP